MINAAKALAEYFESSHAYPDGFQYPTAPDQCAACNGKLEETGFTTTTNLEILKCTDCARGYIRNAHTLDLEPIYGFSTS